MTATSPWSDVVVLTKPGICFLALVMGGLGFWLANPMLAPRSTFFWMLLGQALIGAAAGILNQYLEVETDRKMDRTAQRPLPMGRMAQASALRWGLVLGILGDLVLLFGTNSVTAVLGAVTMLLYLSVYTPSKRLTPLSTLFGAVPGAMPPLIGYTAAHGFLGRPGLWLFAILFLWQIPHFLAIAWIYRGQYARAGLPVLSVTDPLGGQPAKQAFLYSIVLIPMSLLPAVWGLASGGYFVGAIGLGATLTALSMWLGISRTERAARTLFWGSLIYLPLLGLLLVLNRTL